ncbi:hypothetical protein HA075_07325 [bacterium BFN5]|nr:hypothetical protein HA075_07275 [bacterium BFN5]QJW45677.1 hypothetical protein HA075_07325 [bacterium BFN5]
MLCPLLCIKLVGLRFKEKDWIGEKKEHWPAYGQLQQKGHIQIWPHGEPAV